MKSVGCLIPILLVVILGVVGAIVAGAINTAQLGVCAVPSAQFVNADACRAAITGARTLYMLGGSFFGMFAGFMAGLTFYILIGSKMK